MAIEDGAYVDASAHEVRGGGVVTAAKNFVQQARAAAIWAFCLLCALFVAGVWNAVSPRWFLGLVSAFFVLAVLGLNGRTFRLLAQSHHELMRLTSWFQQEDRQQRDELSQCRRFIHEFRPGHDHIMALLRSAAYGVLPYHKTIVALHATGVGSVDDTLSPEDQRAVLAQRYRERVESNEKCLRGNLDRFRSLRDLARAFKYDNLPDSWKDHIDPQDFPPNSRRLRTGEGEWDGHPDEKPRDPDSIARTLAKGLRDALMEEGSDEDRIHAQSRDAAAQGAAGSSVAAPRQANSEHHDD